MGFRNWPWWRVAVWLPLLGWTATIFYISSQTHPKGADTVDLIPIVRGDLAVHFGLYFVLGLFTFLAIRNVRGIKSNVFLIGLVVATVALVATADEIYQAFVPLRTSSVWDWIADVAGGASAALLMMRVWTFFALKKVQGGLRS